MILLAIVPALLLLAAAGLAAAIVFGTRPPPPPLAIVDALGPDVDLRDLPALKSYLARDGSKLAYRSYLPPGAAGTVAVLVHGSSGSSVAMHTLGKALAGAGIAAYALDMRGHGLSGRNGDVDYIGQLEDDMVDFLQSIRPQHAGGKFLLIGHSSGGGFVIRFAGGPHGDLFDAYLPLSPYLRYDAPTARPANGDWARAYVPRIVGLTILSRVGLPWFQYLPVVAFAVDPAHTAGRTTRYSFRLAANFGPHTDYLADVRGIRRPTLILIGANDELFRPERYAPLLQPVLPTLTVEIIPGVTHMGMVSMPAALAATVAAAKSLLPTSQGTRP